MPLSFLCPAGHKVTVPEDWVGRSMSCPVCSSRMVVPAPPPLVDAPWPEEDARSGTRVLGYRPDRDKVMTVRGLALVLVAVVVFSAVPAVMRVFRDSLLEAPQWAQAALLVATLQLAYVAWMVSAPDWSTVWVVMCVFALVASAYALVMGVALFTPATRMMILEMTDERDRAWLWCAVVVMVMLLPTALCGRVAYRWRKTLAG